MSFTTFEATPGYKGRHAHIQPPLKLNHEIGLPGFPQRATRGGHFKQQLGFIPQLFSLKYNGWMCLVHFPSLTCWNRHGKRLTIENEFTDALDQIKKLMEYFSPGCSKQENVEGYEQWFVCEALSRRHSVDRGCLFIIDTIPTQDSILGNCGPPDLHTSFEKRHEVLRQASAALESYNRHNPQNGLLPIHKWYTKISDRENYWVKQWPYHRTLQKNTVGGRQALFLIDQFKATDDELIDIWNRIPVMNHQWGCEYYEGFVATDAKSKYKLALSPNQSQNHIIKYRHDN